MARISKKTGLATAAVLFVTLPVLLLASCAPGVVGAPEELPPFSNNCMMCSRWMEGSFSNEEMDAQSGTSTSHWLHQARIWDDRNDGIWLYSELIGSGGEGRPLHQVVYRVNDDLAGGIVIESYRLPGNPGRFLGDWQAPRAFNVIEPMNLNPQPGCRINLKRDARGGLSGAGSGTACSSSLPESRYQQTKLDIGPLEIKLWLMGFEESGRQVFALGEDGMIFSRKNPSKAPVSLKPGTGEIPDLGPYELKQEQEKN